jgi:REP element-mobilizing transposase RayT
MPIPSKYLADFVEDRIYHVYNRTNNRQPLFKNDDNRYYFLKRYTKYLQPVLDTFCWNLLPNHFHFLVRVKPVNEIMENIISKFKGIQPSKGIQPLEGWIPLEEPRLSKTEQKFLNNEIILSQLVEHYFKSFFQSYSLSFNRAHKQKGNLFYKPFKRVEIYKESHFTQAIIYIHANAQKHKLCKDFRQHTWSSWHTMLSNQPTQLCRKELLDWFGGLKPFIDAHLGMSDYYYSSDVGIEDD